MNKNDKIYVAGHTGLVGSAIVRELRLQGYDNLILKTRTELDLTNQALVNKFFGDEKPEYVFLAAAKVGGINFNKLYAADFITENLQIQTNIIKSSFDHKVTKLLFLGSACFTAGQVVFTKSGYKNIEDVNIGDYILTHTNTFKEVYNVYSKNSNKLIKIKSVGNEVIECTPDHEFLTYSGIWVEAKDLTREDYICIPKHYNTSNIKEIAIFKNSDDISKYIQCKNFLDKTILPSNPEEHRWNKGSLPRMMKLKNVNFNSEEPYSISYLIGVFLAEGWVVYKNTNKRGSRHSLSFSPGFDPLFINNIETALNTVCDSYIKYNKRTSVYLGVNSKILCEFFLDFYSDKDIKRAHTKIIPEYIFNLSKSSLIEIIKGYWDGDGCIHKRKNRIEQYTCIAASTSKDLIYGLRRILFQLGIFSSINFIKKANTAIIEGRTVNQKNQYSLRINGKYAIKFLNDIYDYNIVNDKTNSKILEDKNYFFSKIVSTEEIIESKTVYDLTILDDHSYTVNDVIVHNCIYPKITEQPIKEEYLMTSKLEETNDGYAIAKIAGALMCQKYKQQYGFNCISLMPTNLYGIGDRFNIEHGHVIPGLINKFLLAKESGDSNVSCWGDGSPTREFLYSDDLADACIFLMNTYDSEEILNIGIDNEITIKDLAEKIKEKIGFSGEILWDTTKPNGTPRRKVCNDKLYSLGWRPKYNLDEGLDLTINWYKNNIGFTK
jgi:nucleoside-diphosphate-sugar epimerase